MRGRVEREMGGGGAEGEGEWNKVGRDWNGLAIKKNLHTNHMSVN